MARARHFLDRFRPAGAPGAPSAVGVPVDRLADAERELAGVFAALDEAQDRCARLRAEARDAAWARSEQAQRAAAVILAQARERAAAERADAAATATAAAHVESMSALARARDDAESDRADALGRMPGLVARIVERARRDAMSLTANDLR